MMEINIVIENYIYSDRRFMPDSFYERMLSCKNDDINLCLPNKSKLEILF